MDAIKEALKLLQSQRDAIDRAMHALTSGAKLEESQSELLTGDLAPTPTAQNAIKKRTRFVSPATRRKIAAGMKKKWAERKA